MTTAFATATCSRCRGAAYLVSTGRALAIARPCPDCSGECRRCGGAGRRLVETDGRREMRRCECQALAEKIRRFNAAAIPNHFAESTLESFLAGKAMAVRPHEARVDARELVRDFVDNYLAKKPGKGLLLMGRVGVGKSHLLVAALRKLVFEKGVRCRYAELFLVFSEIRAGISAGKSHAEVIGPLAEVDVLALDELGKGRCSEFELNTLDEIVNRRYHAGRTTLFATNYTDDPSTTYRPPALQSAVAQQLVPAETLIDRVGERIYSRLKDMCDFVFVDGADFRRKFKA